MKWSPKISLSERDLRRLRELQCGARVHRVFHHSTPRSVSTAISRPHAPGVGMTDCLALRLPAAGWPRRNSLSGAAVRGLSGVGGGYPSKSLERQRNWTRTCRRSLGVSPQYKVHGATSSWNEALTQRPCRAGSRTSATCSAHINDDSESPQPVTPIKWLAFLKHVTGCWLALQF